MTDVRNPLDRLVEKQEEEIEKAIKQLELWTKYKNDYEGLQTLVNTMKDKVRHPYKIPIAGSQLAFVPGHIIHTNELTVLLGDNYFVLRSAKQASQIIDRRLDNIKETIKKTKDSKKKTEDWLAAAREHKRDKEGFVEIIETM